VTHDQVEAMTLADRIAVLSAGHVMQYASPDEIYNRPAAKFVAGFTGSPSMNFAAATVSADGASVVVAGATVALGYARKSAAGREVTFGVRPEDIDVGGDIPARVVVIEPLGAETLVTLAIGSGKPVEMITRVDADTKLTPGDQIKVSINAAKTHLFDLKTELAITQ
jgi:multiple sugar transport system ATP-binding protein